MALVLQWDVSQKKANVPDGKKATEIMQRIIKKIRPMDLSKADFNKTSERFFSVVSKEQQWKFFEEYFTDVKVNGCGLFGRQFEAEGD